MLTPEEEKKVQEETYARMRKDIRQQEEYRALVEPLIEKIVADYRKAFRLVNYYLSVESYQPHRWSVTFILKSADVRAEARAKDFLAQLEREVEAGIAAINRTIGDKQPIEMWGVTLADMTEIEAAGGFASFFA